MTTGVPAIRVESLATTFVTGAAVQDLAFDVAGNEFLTLVGPSGCGRSTTLRVVAGLVRPTAGRVPIRGRPVAGPIRDVGMVFQSPVLLPWRTTLAIVCEFIGGNRGVGFLILSGQFNLDTPLVFASPLSITPFTTVAVGGVALLEHWLLAWRPSRRRR
jgi:hypothetical protein